MCVSVFFFFFTSSFTFPLGQRRSELVLVDNGWDKVDVNDRDKVLNFLKDTSPRPRVACSPARLLLPPCVASSQWSSAMPQNAHTHIQGRGGGTQLGYSESNATPPPHRRHCVAVSRPTNVSNHHRRVRLDKRRPRCGAFEMHSFYPSYWLGLHCAL